MTTYYLNHSIGDDANDGSTWALAWKTITSGATAARIAPGDIIKIAKTPDPTLVGTATWTDKSLSVTLDTAVNANIDLCASAWSVVSNVTCTTSATRKQGSTSISITIGAAFTSGKVAYKTLSSLDLSGYEQVSFWIRSSIAVSGLQIKLCSDTLGNTPVDELTLPAISVINNWYPVTINKNAALGSAIQSVALYALVDPGAPVILLDDIVACKSAASASSLSLKSLISKNSAAQGGVLSWHGIQSIDGVTVKLDSDVQTEADSGRGYSGTTENVSTYKREAYEITATETVNDSGTETAHIYYEAGYDTATGLQDGETFIDGIIGTFVGLTLGSRSWIDVNYMSFIRCTYGVSLTSCYYNTVNLGSLCNNTSNGLYFSSTSACNITVRDCCNNGTYGVNLNGNGHEITITNINSNDSNGIQAAIKNTHLNVTNCKNNDGYGFYAGSSCNNVRGIINTDDNVSGGIYQYYGLIYLNKSTIAETTEVTGFAAYDDGSLFSTLHDNTAASNKIYTYGGTITSQSAVRQTTTGVAWKMAPNNTARNSMYPLTLPIARVAVDAGAAVSVFAWFLRDSLDITGKMVCRGGQVAGLTTTQTATITAGIDTWQELSLTFTPTESGVVEIEAWAYGGTTNSIYVDSIRIT